MTAWRLGEDASRRQAQGLADGTSALSFVGRVLEWIPADVVGLFAAAITALEAEPAEDSAKYLIVGGAILAILAVIGGAWAGDGFNGKVWLRAGLAPIAFLIWSPTVPNSGWQDNNWIGDHPQLTVAICAVIAFLFALLAQGLEKRVKT